MPYRISVDTGGTFTDVCLIDRASGAQWSVKTPSTPDDPSRGFIEGIRQVLQEAGIEAQRVSHVFHGTTVAPSWRCAERTAHYSPRAASSMCWRSGATTYRAAKTCFPGSSRVGRFRPSASSKSAGAAALTGTDIKVVAISPPARASARNV